VFAVTLKRMATILEEVGDVDSKATPCLYAARQLNNGIDSMVQITEQISALHFKKGESELAIKEQKRAYTLLRELIPNNPKDERLMDARNRLEKYYRKNAEEQLEAMMMLQQQSQQQQQLQVEKDHQNQQQSVLSALSASQDDMDGTSPIDGEKKKSSKKKNKTKK